MQSTTGPGRRWKRGCGGSGSTIAGSSGGTGVSYRYGRTHSAVGSRVRTRGVGSGLWAGDHEALVPELVEALLIYPRPFRERLIREVRIEDTLYDGEFEWGGFAACGEASVHLAVGALSPRAAGDALHHEIGHLIYCDDRFPRDVWDAVSASYMPLSPMALRLRIAPLDLDRDLFPSGFLTAYGATTPHEDAAEFLRLWRTRPQRVNDLATHHPLIRAKRSILRDWAERVGVAWYDRG